MISEGVLRAALAMAFAPFLSEQHSARRIDPLLVGALAKQAFCDLSLGQPWLLANEVLNLICN